MVRDVYFAISFGGNDGLCAALKQRKGDPVQAELDSAMKRIGELTMQVELLEAKTETFGPLGRRRSRR